MHFSHRPVGLTHLGHLATRAAGKIHLLHGTGSYRHPLWTTEEQLSSQHDSGLYRTI